VSAAAFLEYRFVLVLGGLLLLIELCAPTWLSLALPAVTLVCLVLLTRIARRPTCPARRQP
jgi:hypothetical protein